MRMNRVQILLEGPKSIEGPKTSMIHKLWFGNNKGLDA